MEIKMFKAAVIMGSDSDLPVVEKAFAVLDEYGVPYEAHVMSAHRTPEAVASFVKGARANGFGVIIAAAGMAALLAAQILAVEDASLADRLDAKRKSDAQKVLEKDAALQAELNK